MSANVEVATQSALTVSEVPVLETRGDRIRWIVDQMITGQWARGDYGPCATAWNVSAGTVAQYSDMAGMHLELLGDKDRVLQLTTARLERFSSEDKPDRVPATIALHKAMGGFAKVGSSDPPSTEDDRKYVVNCISRPNAEWRDVLEAALYKANADCKRIVLKAVEYWEKAK